MTPDGSTRDPDIGDRKTSCMTVQSYRHILAVLDLGTDSRRIAERGLNLAARHSSRLSLLHVIEAVPFDPAGELPFAETADIRHRQEEYSRRLLDRLAVCLELPAKRCHLRHGVIKTEVARAVRELGVDLVVLGRHERHGLRLLWGGAEDTIVHAVPCDVLGVHIP